MKNVLKSLGILDNNLDIAPDEVKFYCLIILLG